MHHEEPPSPESLLSFVSNGLLLSVEHQHMYRFNCPYVGTDSALIITTDHVVAPHHLSGQSSTNDRVYIR